MRTLSLTFGTFGKMSTLKSASYPFHVLHEDGQALCLLNAPVVADDAVMVQLLVQVDLTMKDIHLFHGSWTHRSSLHTFHRHFLARRQIATQKNLGVRCCKKLRKMRT